MPGTLNRQHILNAHPNAKLTVYAIWLPILAGDSRDAWDAHVLDDPRVVSLWDGSRLAGKWFADRSLGGLGGGTLLRHTIDGEAFGKYEAIWRERIEPGHDLVLEALLDNIEAAVA